MYDLLIKNGVVVTPEYSAPRDIGISDEKIVAIGVPGSLNAAAQEINAAGMLVLPGLIDPHVHIYHPYSNGFSADDFFSATRSAAFGGVTTVCDFAIQWDKNKSLTETCRARKTQFAGESVVDYALHACPTCSEPETLRQLSKLFAEGIPSVKLYMTYSKQGRMTDDAILLEALKLTAKEGGIVGVHAENDAMCLYYSEQYRHEGRVSPVDFPLCKNDLVEAEAINRAIYLARMSGGSLYIFHLSTAEGLSLLRRARADGVHVYAETCTHYLTLNDSKYSEENGANLICSPPLRSQKDVEALWKGVAEGIIGVVSSDHCGFSLQNKQIGGGAFPETPNGLPGIEVRLPALYTYGVKTGRISINRMTALLSENPARAFGMYPKKGAICIGSDADIVVLDPAKSRIISSEVLHSPVDWSPFDGETLYGVVKNVWLRGKEIVRDDCFLGSRGDGMFVPRSTARIDISH